MSSRRHGPARRVHGAPGLSWRQLVDDPWVSIFLAVMVALVACVATLWPRFVLDMNSRQVPHMIGALSSLQRDVSAVYVTTLFTVPGRDYTSVESTWGAHIEGLERVRQAQPEPLRSLMEPGQFIVDVGTPSGTDPKVPDPSSDIADTSIQLRVDPFLTEHTRLVEGSWPEVVILASNDGANFGNEGGAGQVPGDQGPVQVAIVDSAAKRLGWKVGTEFSGYLLTGTYEPTDPSDPRWSQSQGGAAMTVVYDGNIGNRATLVAYLPGANPGTIGDTANNRMRFWYTLDGSAVAGDQVDTVTAQLVGLASGPSQLVPATDDDPEVSVTFTSDSVATFRALGAQQAATASILGVVAAGPVGVTLAAFALAARLLVSRRRSALALATARGGSGTQIRSLLALEGLIIGVPAAALGYLAAGRVLDRSTGWTELLVAGLVAAVPAAALALSSGQRSLREERSDLRSRSGSRIRWIVEAMLVALAGVAIWRLLDRGLTGVSTVVTSASGSAATGGAAPTGGAPAPGGASTTPVAVVVDGGGVDLLMAATPVVLALAACAITLRLYPLPVQAMVRTFRRNRGLTAFLGAARSVRDPAGGIIPALAVILGVAVAVFSSVMASTITRGAETAAWNANGAQVKLAGPWLTDDLVDTIGSVDGVTAVARVGRVTSEASFTTGPTTTRVTVYVVDSSLGQVQSMAPQVAPLPPDVFATGPGATRVLTGGSLSTSSGAGTLQKLGAVQVVGHVDRIPGSDARGAFLVVERGAWEAAGQRAPNATVALIGVQDPDKVATAAASIAEAVPNSQVSTTQQELDLFESAPVTSGLLRFFVAAVVLTALVTILAILIVQLMGAPARARVLAVLRTLGIAPRQGRALTAWELAPLIATAFLVGAALGVVIPWLLLRAVDLTGMTGADAQPALTLDWTVLGPVLAGILAAVAVAVTVSATVAGRTNLARQLRIGEER